MTKKIQTIKAVKAYPVLKSLKVADLSDDAMFAVWKNIKALRPVSEEYGKEREEVVTTLQDDTYQQMQSRLAKAQERERKVNCGEYTMKAEDMKDVQEINAWFAQFNGKAEKYFSDMDKREVDLDVASIPEKELLKAVKASGGAFSAMEELEWLTE